MISSDWGLFQDTVAINVEWARACQCSPFLAESPFDTKTFRSQDLRAVEMSAGRSERRYDRL
jgi:hypothetical protein